jgi:hypothetical protein
MCGSWLSAYLIGFESKKRHHGTFPYSFEIKMSVKSCPLFEIVCGSFHSPWAFSKSFSPSFSQHRNLTFSIVFFFEELIAMYVQSIFLAACLCELCCYIVPIRRDTEECALSAGHMWGWRSRFHLQTSKSISPDLSWPMPWSRDPSL